jgi:signal transduction histidine kinase
VREPAYLSNRSQFDQWSADIKSLHSALAGRRTVPVLVEDVDGRRREIHARVEGFSFISVLPILIPSLTIAIAATVIGLLVFWKRPENPAARALIVLCQCALPALVVTMVNTTRGLTAPPLETRILYELNLLGLVFGAACFFRLAATFPERRFGRHSDLVSFFVPMACATVAYLLDLVGVFGATLLCSGILITASFAFVVASQFTTKQQIKRLEALWIMWGLAVPAVFWVVLRFPYALGLVRGGDPSDYLMSLGTLGIPIGIGVAILRYRLLDIGIVVRRTILSAVVVIAALFLYALGVSAFAHELTADTAPTTGFNTVFITALVLATILFPAQAALESVLDRVFFRNRFHYRRVLAGVPDDLAASTTPDVAADLVIAKIGESMDSPRVVVSLTPKEGGEIRVWSRIEPDVVSARAESLRPRDDAAFWAAVESLKGPHLCAPDQTTSPLDRWMLAEALDLVLPLRTPEELVGLLACAAPRKRRLLSADDVASLRSVASALALALSRTQAQELIQQMNRDLERTVEQRSAELERARLQLYQWEKMASIGVLAAGVAHELNTPLGIVLSTADQLATRLEKSGAGNAEAAREIRLSKLCLEGAQRAAHIVGDLRAYSRPETEDLGIVELAQVVESTLRLLGSSLRGRNVKVEVSHAEGVPPIEGYVSLINQTLTNLVLNAAHAMGQDGAIRVSTERRGDDHVALVVEDTGPGIPSAIKERMFEPFFTTKPPGEGTGLGLSLCYTFVQQHGGRIWEEGEPGKGARFVVELPVRLPPSLRTRAPRS